MSNGAATLEVARPGQDARAATGAVRRGFSVRRMRAVMAKELRSYFAFPLVYVVSGIFLLLSGWYAYTDLVNFMVMGFGGDIIQNYWQLVFNDVRFCLLAALPFVTMRSFAEERKLGTVELLYTLPLRDGEILAGKFLGALVIFQMMLGLTLTYPAYLYSIHAFPLPPIFAGYLGLILLGASVIALGMFISSLCESQVVAGFITFFALILLTNINWNEAAFETSAIDLFRAFSLFDQYEKFGKGVIDLDKLTYFLFFSGFFLYLTLKSMEARKWTGRR
ncbi:MAG: ABC transporter permease [Candidatus Binataceae bacterium]